MTEVQIAGEPSATAERPELNTAGVTRFVWIALAVVALVQAAVIAVERSLIPSTVRPLRHAVSEFPLVIEHWTGKEAELDPRIFAKIEADGLINRIYTNPAGETITVHCASWVSTHPGVPHPPELCYTSNGWKLLQARTATLPGRPDVRIAVQKYELSGQRVLVIHWYQMDDRTFVDFDGARTVRRAYWGRRELPPLIKTLLQADDTDHAESDLFGIAAHIYEFNREL
jgi:hypothetical protein